MKWRTQFHFLFALPFALTQFLKLDDRLERHLLIIWVTISAKKWILKIVLRENEQNLVENWLKLRGTYLMIALVIGKNQNIRKSTVLHSLYLIQCLEKMSLCNLNIFLCISIEKREPRIIPRSRPSASTSKRTSASVFSISIPKEKSQITLGKIF